MIYKLTFTCICFKFIQRISIKIDTSLGTDNRSNISVVRSSIPVVTKAFRRTVLALRSFSVSIQRLRRALHLAIRKHATLHTSVFHDPVNNKWIQQVQPLEGEGFSLNNSQIDMSPTAIEQLIQKEYAFGIHDMKNGCNVRMHLVRRSDRSEDNDDGKLVCGDIIIINIRHEAIDGTSLPILFDSLTQAYSTGELPVDSHALTYLDYMLYLQKTDLSPSFAYWNQQMESFDFAEHFKRLPQDRP